MLFCGSLQFTAIVRPSLPLYTKWTSWPCVSVTELVQCQYVTGYRKDTIKVICPSLPFPIAGKWYINIFSFLSEHIPRVLWVESEKLVHGARVPNCLHMIALWYEPQQRPAFVECHCLSVMVRCSNKANHTMLLAMRLESQQQETSCSDPVNKVIAISSPSQVPKQQLPIGSVDILLEIPAIYITTLWSEVAFLLEPGEKRKRKENRKVGATVNPQTSLWIKAHRKFPGGRGQCTEQHWKHWI